MLYYTFVCIVESLIFIPSPKGDPNQHIYVILPFFKTSNAVRGLLSDWKS